ncbi:MAG: hypothetical protein IKR64_00555 [Treponema sp.]|nr:hypothetical protein [Treponema sp.]
MQSISLLKAVLENNADKTHFLFNVQDFYSLFPNFTEENLRMLLSRASKNGILERICKGIYLYPKSGYDSSLLLFKVAAKFRADCMNYVSLESVLCETGKISQQLIGWITVMTTGRSGKIKCGRFGTVELIHTSKSMKKLMPHLRLDARTGLWWADEELALQDMKTAKRNFDLIVRGATHVNI